MQSLHPPSLDLLPELGHPALVDLAQAAMVCHCMDLFLDNMWVTWDIDRVRFAQTLRSRVLTPTLPAVSPFPLKSWLLAESIAVFQRACEEEARTHQLPNLKHFRHLLDEMTDQMEMAAKSVDQLEYAVVHRPRSPLGAEEWQVRRLPLHLGRSGVWRSHSASCTSRRMPADSEQS